ncbi:TIGR03546 family protein [Exilibacterium tricleocarpae]|uniref:TIGR03546 family protein n=1 Tax=Exilibacterium tricleocarpae TaxID=2591008 RepID=A0A545U4D8_9GAMM|nr:TIGR03546 family protein [Exilibacterium tricleocarpae]
MRLLVKLLKVLNAEDNPAQIALAVCLAAILGLTPLLSLHNLLILFLVLVLRVNISAFLLFALVFSGIAYLLDPLFHRLGHSLLTAEGLQGMWTLLYNTAAGRLSEFNNTLTLGSLVFAVALSVPLFFAAKTGVDRYRARLLPWVEKTHLVRVLKASRFYRLYTQTGWE